MKTFLRTCWNICRVVSRTFLYKCTNILNILLRNILCTTLFLFLYFCMGLFCPDVNVESDCFTYKRKPESLSQFYIYARYVTAMTSSDWLNWFMKTNCVICRRLLCSTYVPSKSNSSTTWFQYTDFFCDKTQFCFILHSILGCFENNANSKLIYTFKYIQNNRRA